MITRKELHDNGWRNPYYQSLQDYVLGFKETTG